MGQNAYDVARYLFDASTVGKKNPEIAVHGSLLGGLGERAVATLVKLLARVAW